MVSSTIWYIVNSFILKENCLLLKLFIANSEKCFWAPDGNRTRNLLISGEPSHRASEGCGFDSRLGLRNIFAELAMKSLSSKRNSPLIYQAASHLLIYIFSFILFTFLYSTIYFATIKYLNIFFLYRWSQGAVDKFSLW